MNNIGSIFQIGRDFFDIEIWLYNFLPGYKPIKIPFFYINELVIEESLADWNTIGYFVLEQNCEFLERGASSVVSDGINIPEIKSPYLFRPDGRNRLSIKVTPNPLNNQNNVSGPLDPAYWQINYDFVIYDIQDISQGAPNKKMRAYYFKMESHQILSERNLEWSTGMDKPVTSKDSEKIMSGNDAIKSILKSAASLGGSNKDSLKIGYTDKGSIDKPDVPLDQIDENINDPTTNNWATAPDLSTCGLLYTSPANHFALDDINYFIDKTKSADNSPVFLRYGRWSGDKSWKLTPLSKIFKQSSINQIEVLTIDDKVEAGSAPPKILRGDISKVTSTLNFSSPIASIITAYNYVPMVATDDNYFCNTPLYQYDFSKSTYNVFFNQNKVTNVLESMKKTSSGLFNLSNNGQVMMPINKTKVSGIKTANKLAATSFFLPDYPLIKMMKNFVLLNNAIHFQAPGLTLRTPGKFIYIDRALSANTNSFDDKFLGQWLLTKVTHTWSKEYYINDVVAVKIDAFSNLFPSSDNSP